MRNRERNKKFFKNQGVVESHENRSENSGVEEGEQERKNEKGEEWLNEMIQTMSYVCVNITIKNESIIKIQNNG